MYVNVQSFFYFSAAFPPAAADFARIGTTGFRKCQPWRSISSRFELRENARSHHSFEHWNQANHWARLFLQTRKSLLPTLCLQIIRRTLTGYHARRRITEPDQKGSVVAHHVDQVHSVPWRMMPPECNARSMS